MGCAPSQVVWVDAPTTAKGDLAMAGPLNPQIQNPSVTKIGKLFSGPSMAGGPAWPGVSLFVLWSTGVNPGPPGLN